MLPKKKSKLSLSPMKRIEVVAAVIQHQNKILAVQRGPAKYAYISEKWEFPGGKMEADETEEQTIIREIREELDMQIEVKSKLLTVEHPYPDFHLTMHTYSVSYTHLTLPTNREV